MKVLVSAFKPFNNEINNYSMEVLKYLDNVDKAIIDVIYDDCYKQLSNNNLDEYDLIIALGEARSRSELTLETKAYNLSSCSLKDNAGIIKKECVINESLDKEINTKVNYNLVSNMVKLSDNPGRFVCNNLYFHLLSNYPDKSLFIHVPNCENNINKYKEYASLITEIIKALTSC